MTRSITSRHLGGGFVGGVAGVLAFYFLTPAMLPLGCFMGVVLGFWYQELGRMAMNSWATASSLKTWNIDPAHLPLYGRMSRWASEHPVNAARLSRWFAIPGAFGVYVAAVIYGVNGNLIPVSPEENRVMIIFMLALFGSFGPIIRSAVFPDESDGQDVSGRMKAYYQLQVLYNRWGAWLFVREFVLTLGTTILAIAGLASLLIAALVFGAAAVVLVPLLGLYLMLWGFLRIAFSKGHWLCLGVTVATTWVVASTMKQDLVGMQLWLAALFAGFASGTLSIFVHRMLVGILAASPRLTIFARKLPSEHARAAANGLQTAWSWLVTPAGYQYGLRAALAGTNR